MNGNPNINGIATGGSSGRPAWLRPAHALWFIIAAASTASYILGEYAHWYQLSHPPHAVLLSVARAHLPLSFYVDYLTALSAVFGGIFLFLGLLIAYRRFDDRIGLVTSALLVLWAGGSPPDSNSAAQVFPVIAPLPHTLDLLMLIALSVFLFVFPDGRVIPRRAGIPLALFLVVTLGIYAAQGLPSPDQTGVSLLVFAADFFGLAAQIYRYRRVSTTLQRQQTKWVLIGLAFALVIEIPFVFVNVPTVGIPGTQYDLLSTTVLGIAFGSLPVTITIAILRYKLWDIDALINRALVYGSLTITLAALYIGGVIGVQAVLRAITGQSSQLAVAVVTLAIAALFNPWRHRLQRFIDRRFYRHRYDATRTLATFQSKLRDEVDLDQLSTDVITVVQDTVQPVSVALWLAGRRSES